ncbi:TPA: hypothetical protein KNH21_003624 [Clostridioides difficile]|nr:hypothetical protein [Clostridioides difficile]HBE9110305.1 hypothetical protein [Clostridioides difficile]
MMDLRCISLHFYYKILTESGVFYANANFKEATGDISKMTSLETFEKMSNEYRQRIAEDTEVDESKIISVSCKEYYENTDED